MTTVVQSWVVDLTWKKQTVLFCALRGPDAAGHHWLKDWVRWIRKHTLQNAAPNKTFMRDVSRPVPFCQIANDQPLVLDMLPIHFLGHLMHALQVLAYHHPDREVAAVASEGYYDLVTFLHLAPESSHEFHHRLSDEV